MTILYFTLLGAYTVVQFIQMVDKLQGSTAQSLTLYRDNVGMNVTFQPSPLGYRFAIGFRNTNFNDSYGKFYAKQVNSTVDYNNIELEDDGFPFHMTLTKILNQCPVQLTHSQQI